MKILHLSLLLALTPSLLAQDGPSCEGIPTSVDGQITLELVTDQVDRPVDVASTPSLPDHIFVVEHDGIVRVIDITTDTLLPTPFLNISNVVDFGGESGLLGLAFHPDFETNRLFFVCYISTRSGSRESIISRFEVTEANPRIADSTSEQILIRFPQPRSNHNGGKVAFGPHDGMLYISVGDGGKQGDPDNNAQDPLSFLGKILRIDVDPGGATPYTIPEDNPFPSQDDILPEIWGLGLRNPWRMAFDRANGDLYVGDVGQNTWEEISRVPAGEFPQGVNFEWRVLEGDNPHSPGTQYAHGDRLGPIYEYHHSSGAVRGVSVTGGEVYRGCAIPQLDGTYFFADYGANWVRSFRVDDEGNHTDLVNRTAALNAGIADFDNGVDSISAFGTDARGEIYICDLPSKLFRIIPVETGPPPPVTFRRGDTNGDGFQDISDMIVVLLHLFQGFPEELVCDDAADLDDDGTKSITDPILGLNILFRGVEATEPYSTCGPDLTEDGLDCNLDSCDG